MGNGNWLAELAAVFAGAFVIALSGAAMPGPLLAVTVTESARRGAKAGPLLVFGHALLEGALVGGVTLGLARFLQQPLVLGIVGCAGGAMLLWMGQDMLRSARGLTLAAAARADSRLHPVAAGVLVSLSNPYWTLWWVTIGMGYLLNGLRFGPAGVLAFFAGHILADLAWYTLVSVAVARGRRVMSDRAYRLLIAFCAVVLLAFGAWFGAAGAGALYGCNARSAGYSASLSVL